jgi:tetratricopeptide (TPR) repeat protein
MQQKANKIADFAILTTLLIMIMSLNACKGDVKKGDKVPVQKTTTNEVLQFELDLYQRAVESGDHHTAVVAIQRALLIDSSLTDLYDSLPRHYMRLTNIKSAAHYAEKSLLLDPGNIDMLQLAGYIYFEGGSFRKAEEKFSKLYELTKDLSYIYQLSQIHMNLGDVQKANKMIDLILKDETSSEVFVDLSTTTGSVQQVNIRAACYLIRANMQDSAGKAIGFLKKALQIQPNFDIARKMKDELEIMEEKEKLQKIQQRIQGR